MAVAARVTVFVEAVAMVVGGRRTPCHPLRKSLFEEKIMVICQTWQNISGKFSFLIYCFSKHFEINSSSRQNLIIEKCIKFSLITLFTTVILNNST